MGASLVQNAPLLVVQKALESLLAFLACFYNVVAAMVTRSTHNVEKYYDY